MQTLLIVYASLVALTLIGAAIVMYRAYRKSEGKSKEPTEAKSPLVWGSNGEHVATLKNGLSSLTKREFLQSTSLLAIAAISAFSASRGQYIPIPERLTKTGAATPPSSPAESAQGPSHVDQWHTDHHLDTDLPGGHVDRPVHIDANYSWGHDDAAEHDDYHEGETHFDVHQDYC